MFGLPPRTAIAGIAYPDVPGGIHVVTVSSAEHQRDRESWARRRLLLSVAAAAGLVLAFGGVALRMQRKELVLEAELAVAALQRRSDERLERTSKAAAFGTLAIGVAHEISTPLGVIRRGPNSCSPRSRATKSSLARSPQSHRKRNASGR